MNKELQQYIFYGYLFPLESQVQIDSIRTYGKVLVEGEEVVVDLSINITNSKLTVLCQTNLDDFLTLRNTVLQEIQKLVDTFSFTQFIPLQVVLGEALNFTSGKKFSTPLSINFLDDLKKEPSLSIAEILKLLSNNPVAHLVNVALDNFRLALNHAADTAFFAFRSIEAIKNTFPGNDDAQKWKELRKNLNFTVDYLNAFKKHADLQRHGNVLIYVAWRERKEQLEIAWTVLNRCFHFLKNGKIKLDEQEFPLI